jgi:hypothetical protein
MFVDNPLTQLDNDLTVKSKFGLMLNSSEGAKFKRIPTTNDVHWDLIRQCWDSIPKSGPTFSMIVDMLSSNPSEFSLKGTDEEELKATCC